MPDPLRTGSIYSCDLAKLRNERKSPSITDAESDVIAARFDDLVAAMPAPRLETRSRLQPAKPATKPATKRTPRAVVKQERTPPKRPATKPATRRTPPKRPATQPTPAPPAVRDVSTTRSGRRSCRVLEWWKSERLLVPFDGDATIRRTADEPSPKRRKTTS